MADHPRPSFGIKTTPENVGYDDIVRVWQEADAIPEIEHAWLFDHLSPLWSDPSAPIYEGWTLLTALAAQTSRLRLGVMVTNNRLRLPAMLAKIAATVDVISNGRLDFGIGVGGLPGPEPMAEFAANGVPNDSWRDAVAQLDESCSIIRRLWTEDEVDFAGRHYQLTGARSNPRPVQRPHPPIVIAGGGASTLPIVARHADVWNIIGPPRYRVDQIVERSAALDEQCVAIGRDPGEIIRSMQMPVSYDDPEAARQILIQAIDAGFTHLVLNPRAPYGTGVARWLTDEIISPVIASLSA